jgi:hypothetical protein
MFKPLLEELRSAVDDEGAKGCFKKSVNSYSKVSGINIQGLWAVVEAILQGANREKTLKRLQKAWGGPPKLWERWWAIAQTKPDCPGSI